ncbi:MAG: hypothetical protein ACK56I_03670, partial [bacterium]
MRLPPRNIGISGMNQFVLFIIFFNSLFLGIANAKAEILTNNNPHSVPTKPANTQLDQFSQRLNLPT